MITQTTLSKRNFLRLTLAAFTLLFASAALASIFSSVRGIVHDPQHRPVQNAMVMINAKTSDWSSTANSDANGDFAFNAIPVGEYVVSVARPFMVSGHLLGPGLLCGRESFIQFQIRELGSPCPASPLGPCGTRGSCLFLL
jgi:hypothetical protein